MTNRGLIPIVIVFIAAGAIWATLFASSVKTQHEMEKDFDRTEDSLPYQGQPKEIQ